MAFTLPRTLALPVLAFLVSVMAASASPRSARALDIDVTQFTLDNGLQVVVIPDHRAPVVTHMVWYKIGAADEPKGKAGIAHFLEHLMFKGTDKVPPGEFSKIVRRNGGEDNAFTSQDFTAYYQRIAKDRLDLVMSLEADRMQNLKLTDEAVLPERDVVKEERRMRTDNDPASLLSEQIDAALYLAHPYGKPVIGWMDEVAKLSRQDAIDFYHQYYTPKNAILVVAGDVTPEEVKALAEKYYAPLKNTADPPPRMRTPEPEPIAARRVAMQDPKVATPSVQRTYLAPAYASGKKTEAEALEVLAEVLGGSSTSRLYRDLVIDKRVAAQAGASYNGDNQDSGEFTIYAAPVPGGSVDAAEAAMDETLAKFAKDGVTDDEVERAKKRLIASNIYALDSQFRLAYLFGTALTSGRTVDDVLEWEKRIEAVTADDVRNAARDVLEPVRSVTGVLTRGAAQPAVAN
ncbi:MAG: pitrilysin family protein [Hyphomicrobiales bacterium]